MISELRDWRALARVVAWGCVGVAALWTILMGLSLVANADFSDRQLLTVWGIGVLVLLGVAGVLFVVTRR